MKDDLSGLDVHFLVRELQFLVGARFQKAYAREKEVYLQLHKTGEGKQLLRTRLPGLLYLASARPEFPRLPSGFVTFLRKRLKGTRVEAIEQLGMDRIVIFTFGTQSEPELYRFVIELIAPGNVLLLGRKPLKGGVLSEEIILSLLKPHSYKDRTVRGGVPYVSPPPAANVLVDKEEVLVRRVLDSGMDSLVKALAVGLNLGGEYAELVCGRLGVDKGKVVEEIDVKQAIVVTRELLGESPTAGVKDDQIVFFSDAPTHDSINGALDDRFTNYEEAAEVLPKKKKKSILEVQEQQKIGFEKAAVENQRKGEAIYEHYTEIKELIAQVKAGETPTSKAFKKHDKKTRTITVEF